MLNLEFVSNFFYVKKEFGVYNITLRYLGAGQ